MHISFSMTLGNREIEVEARGEAPEPDVGINGWGAEITSITENGVEIDVTEAELEQINQKAAEVASENADGGGSDYD